MVETRDRDGNEIRIGDTVTYRLCDSSYTRIGPVTEIRDSGAMYVQNPRTGYVDLMFPRDVRKVV